MKAESVSECSEVMNALDRRAYAVPTASEQLTVHNQPPHLESYLLT